MVGLVRERIGRIAELIDVKRARNFRRQSRGDILIIFRMPAGHVASRQANFRAERADVGDFLLRHLVGNDEDDAITLRAGDEGEAEAGVARGRLDDRAAGLQLPIALRRLDHRERDAVLDRAGRILVLQLHEKLARTGIHPRDLDQRRVADERKDGGRFVRRSWRRSWS